MESKEDRNTQKTFAVLENAKTDNEKLAALLLFAKVTNARELSSSERKRALDAIGVSFLSRLLKSKSVPDDCPSTVYKSLSLKILSGLCTDSDVLLEFEVYKNLRSINDVITDISSDEDMVDDCYDLLSSFVQTEEGSMKLVDYGTVAALTQVVSSQIQGCDKGQAVLQSVLYNCGDYTWKKEASSMHIVMAHFCKQLDTFQDERKFDLCITVSGILPSIPKEVAKKSQQRAWFKSLIHSLVVIFTSKLGEPQREPALKLSSAVFDRLGVESILPPNTEDCKLLLIVIHLSCIEVRITLENLTPEQILSKTDILVSCYNILEMLIGHMTSAPSLQLDENQVLQLHSAMEGAFNSVIFFLKEQSELEDQVRNPNQIVLASIRVLGSWVAEETSALKARVQEILPFVVKLCKCQVEYPGRITAEKKKVVKFQDDFSNQESNLSSKLQSCNIAMETDKKDAQNNENSDISEKKPQNSCQSNVVSENISPHNTCSCSKSKSDQECPKCKSLSDTDATSDRTDSKQDICCSEKLYDLTIENVDLIRFLMPGFCHMTAEDASRQILLENNFHSILSEYFIQSVDSLEENLDEDSLRSMETLCGVFLNLAVLEPELVTASEDLHKVTKYIFKCAAIIYNKEDTLTLWANIVTLGVFFLRYQADVKFDKDELTKFFSMVVSFIRAPYTSGMVSGTEVLTVTESYLPVWDSIYQLWYLCIQATTSCLSVYPSLVYAMMSTGFLPHIIRLLNRVHGRNVDEDTLLCLIGVITSLVTTEVKAKDVLRSCGGMEFSRLYNCSELEKLIKQ